MATGQGHIRVLYAGKLPDGFREQLSTMSEVEVAGVRPLTLVSQQPEDVLNRIMRYLGDSEMRVERVELRPARAC